jgi:alkylation response protein AidB-like acyl-CoA dehydrogenase
LAQRYSAYRQQSMQAAGEDPGLIGLVNKLNGTQIGHRIAGLAQDLMGGAGLLSPGEAGARRKGVERWNNQVLGSLAVAIAGGSSNIQRNLIAERGLGLPRSED